MHYPLLTGHIFFFYTILIYRVGFKCSSNRCQNYNISLLNVNASVINWIGFIGLHSIQARTAYVAFRESMLHVSTLGAICMN